MCKEFPQINQKDKGKNGKILKRHPTKEDIQMASNMKR